MFALFSHNNHCVKNTADSSEWCFDVTYMHEQCIANKFKPETVLLLTYNVGHSVLINLDCIKKTYYRNTD